MYWSFSFSISPSNEHPGLMSFMMDLLDLLAVQGTLRSLLQHHSAKASVLQCSAFCMVQLSPPGLWGVLGPHLTLFLPLSQLVGWAWRWGLHSYLREVAGLLSGSLVTSS